MSVTINNILISHIEILLKSLYTNIHVVNRYVKGKRLKLIVSTIVNI